jgi:hypothetical protein
MRKVATALTVCVILGGSLLPAAARAGGRPPFQRGLHVRGSSPGYGGVQAIPEFRPKGAFGSPGGFPLAARPGRHGRLPGHGFPRFPYHTVFPRFPSTTFLYTPAALYGPSVETSPPVVTVSPVIYASPIVYVSQPIASSQPTPLPAAPPSEPLPRVVEHPTGRYELRGDGVATPYVWVWLPDPPPAPPAAPQAPPDEPPRSAGRAKTYRWTDENGTLFLTNRLEEIPEPYRSQARGPAQ